MLNLSCWKYVLNTNLCGDNNEPRKTEKRSLNDRANEASKE